MDDVDIRQARFNHKLITFSCFNRGLNGGQTVSLIRLEVVFAFRGSNRDIFRDMKESQILDLFMIAVSHRWYLCRVYCRKILSKIVK